MAFTPNNNNFNHFKNPTTDYQTIEFLRDGTYLIESVYVPIKVDDWYANHNYDIIFEKNLWFHFKEKHFFKNNDKHTLAGGGSEGIYNEFISPILTVVIVKNGIPKIVSTPNKTNLDFKIYRFEGEIKNIEITLEDKSVVNAEDFILSPGTSITKFEKVDSITESQWKRSVFESMITNGSETGDFTYYLRNATGKKKEQKGSFVIKKLLRIEGANFKYNFNATNITNIVFNENFTNETIKETVSHIIDNKLKLTFNKTALSADGYYNYDDWLKILLAQVCVYKLS